MWIMQLREEKGDVWELMKELKPFAMEALVVSASKRTNKKRKHRFRIVLHYNKLDLVVAVAADTFIANQHWTFIEESLLSQFQALLNGSSANETPANSSPTSEERPSLATFRRISLSRKLKKTLSPKSSSPSSSPSSRKKKKKTDAREEDQAIYQFFTLKFTTLTKLETQKEQEQDEKMMKKWNMPVSEAGSAATFYELFEIEEPILGFYNCSLWRKRYHLGGLYVSKNFLCFGSTPLRRRFVFPLSSITQIEEANEKDQLRSVFPDAVSFVANGKKYLLFQFVGAQQVLPVITELWHDAIAQAASNVATKMPVGRASTREYGTGEGPNLLPGGRQRSATSALINPMLSTPLGEAPAELDQCQLRMEGDPVGAIGHFFVSFKMISFSAGNTNVIIPFRYVTGMSKGEKRNTIRVETPTNCCKFAFSSLQRRQSVFKVLMDIWETNKTVSHSLTEWSMIDKILEGIDNDKSDDLKMRIQSLKRRDFRIVDNSEIDAQWEEYFAKYGRGADMIKTAQLKKLIREGIPNPHRRKMWQICSLSLYRMAYPTNYGYQSLLRRIERVLSKDDEAIEKDLRRSLRGIFIYEDERAKDSLRRVLRAFSLRNKIGRAHV